MNELFESLEINEDMKVKLEEAFEKAVMVKATELLDEHVETKLNEEREKLEEEFTSKVELLENTLDGYLASVVEEFVTENAPVYEAEIEQEKVKSLLEMFDGMLKVTGIDMLQIHEAKDEGSLENKIKKLEALVAEREDALHEARKEAEGYLKAGIIQEMKEGLTMVEAEKFENLASLVPFEKNEKYVEALDTIKESIIENRGEDFDAKQVSEAKLPKTAFKEKEVNLNEALDFSAYL
jgi:hypothetical protein